MFIKLFTLFPCGGFCLVSNADFFSKKYNKIKDREREDLVFMNIFVLYIHFQICFNPITVTKL